MATIRQRMHLKSRHSEPFNLNEGKEKQRGEHNSHEGNNLSNYKSDTLQKNSDNGICFDYMQDTIDEFKDALKDFNSKINDIEEKILLQKKFPPSLLDTSDVHKNERKHKHKPDKLPEKEFMFRRSLLTELFEIVHIQTLHNVFIVTLIILLLSTAISDLMETGTTHLGIQTIKKNFGQLPTAFAIWLSLKGSTFLVFYFFKFWSEQYQINDQKTFLSKIKNLQYLIGFIFYIIMAVYLPLKMLLLTNLPTCSSITILMEQIRLIMKTYAFVRSNVPKVTSGKRAPELSKFVYFLFAPTLIYRDNYPRKATINWGFVIWHFTEVVFVIFYHSFLFERMLIPYFSNYGLEPLNIRNLVLSIFGSMLPGTLLFITGFYLLLHAWMNAWAEMMRFGDRIFYKDWWNASTYDHFYRTWNIVVHDWLFTYIYKDIYELLKIKNKTVPLLTTFMISAIVHEYLLAYSFRFFYPVLFISFAGFGVIFVFISRRFNSKLGNLFIWFTICTGNGVVVSLYAIEAFARINCPAYSNGTLDFFVPRSLLTCY